VKVKTDIFDELDVEEKADIFDEVASTLEALPDVFDEIQTELESKPKEKKKIFKSFSELPKQELTASDVISMVKSEIEKIPVVPAEKIVEKIIEKQIIKEVEKEKEDDTDYAEASDLDAVDKKVSKLEKQLKETTRMAESPIIVPGGSGVIGLPSPVNAENKTIIFQNGVIQWGEAPLPTTRYTIQLAYNATTGFLEYVGYALPGSSTSAAVWKIKKLTRNSDNSIATVIYAQSSNSYVYVWDNRTTYTYG